MGVGGGSGIVEWIGNGYVNVGGGGFVGGDNIHDGFGGGSVVVVLVEVW